MARVFALLVAVVLTGCVEFGGPLVGEGKDEGAAETGTDGEPRCGPQSGVVQYVIDGDTIMLTSGHKVRYLLVDTPEITDGKNECWGSQAAEHNAAMVAQKTVTLTYDVECEDVYGRLLAYVEVGDVEVNRELLESGNACVLHIPPNGNGKVAEYQTLEDAAKQAGVGMWGACGTVHCSK